MKTTQMGPIVAAHAIIIQVSVKVLWEINGWMENSQSPKGIVKQANQTEICPMTQGKLSQYFYKFSMKASHKDEMFEYFAMTFLL